MPSRSFRSERCQQSDTHFHRLMLQLGLSRQESVTLNAYKGNEYDRISHLPTQEEKEFERPSSDSTPPSASESSDLSLPLSFQQYKTHQHDDVWSIPECDKKRSHAESENILRRFYQVQVQKIVKRLESCQLNYERSEMKCNEERMQLAKTIQILTESLEEVRSKHEKLIDENQRIKNQLNMEFSHFTDLKISDALAAQLLRQKKETLTLKEFVQLQLHSEITKHVKKSKQQLDEIAFLRNSCEDCQRENSELEKTNLLYRKETEAIQRSLEHELVTVQSAKDLLEENVKKLCGELHVSKHNKCACLQGQPAVEESHVDYDALQQVKVSLEKELRSAKQEVEKLFLDKDNLKQMVDLLQEDKRFLEKTILEHETSKTRWLNSESVLKNRIKEVEASKNELMVQMTKFHEEIRTTIEHKLDSTDKTCMMLLQKEFQTIRHNSNGRDEVETREAHTKTLLEQLRKAEIKITNLDSKLDKKTQELTKREHLYSKTISSLEVELKMRQYEHAELQTKYEEQCAELRKALIQIDLLNQKLQIHQEEFLRLENTSNAKIISLETTLNEKAKSDKLRQVLRKYDEDRHQFESDCLDIDCDSSLKTPCSDGMERQLKILARKVTKYQDEISRNEQKLKSLQAQLLESSRMNNLLRNQLDEFSQPQSYLVNKLRDREAELLQSKLQLEEKSKMFQKLQESSQHTQQTLSRVLSQRDELNGLKFSLSTLRRTLDKTSDYNCHTLGGNVDKRQKNAPVSPARQSNNLKVDPTRKQIVSNPLPGNPPNWYSKLRGME
ncbi:hypothetical protein ABG067_000243 [Albugo candida]